MSIAVIRPGLLTTVQDLGRYGYQKYGVIVSGAMDPYALRVANLLVGNSAGEAGLEITLLGPTLQFAADTLLAITGGDLSPVVDGRPVPLWRPVYLAKDSILQFGAVKSGCRAYLAVAGGYAVGEVMGSKSTYLRAGIGGFAGRALQAGDVLQQNEPPAGAAEWLARLRQRAAGAPLGATSWYAGREHPAAAPAAATVRVMRGSQYSRFSAAAQTAFWNTEFTVTPRADRMGYRLAGAALDLDEPLEMLSEAVALGTIQVPPDGQPIILLADRQTTGGYPKIGQVAVVDAAKVAQVKPGGKIRFTEVTVAEADRLYQEREQTLHCLKTAINIKMKHW